MIAALTFYGLIVAAWFIYAATVRLRGEQYPSLPLTALAGLACWGLSYFLNTAWTLVPAEKAIEFWQLGLTGICLLYLVVRARVLDAFDDADLTLGCLTLILLAVARLGADRDYIDTALIALIVVLCWRCYTALNVKDLFGRLVWVVLLVAEAAQLPQFVICRAFDPGEGSNYRYACDRAFEAPLFTHAPTIVTGLALLWLVSRWYFQRSENEAGRFRH